MFSPRAPTTKTKKVRIVGVFLGGFLYLLSFGTWSPSRGLVFTFFLVGVMKCDDDLFIVICFTFFGRYDL